MLQLATHERQIMLLGINDYRRWLDNSASAASNFMIFSLIFISSAAATCALERENICAANFATLAGFKMKALEEPGGFVRQVLFMPSGGQETTGNFDKYDAVPDRASVPPAQPTIITGRPHLLYSAITDCNRAGCLCAEQMRISASILNLPSPFSKFLNGACLNLSLRR